MFSHITFLSYLFQENASVSDDQILQIADFVVRKVKSILERKVAYENFNQELRKIWNLSYPGSKIRFEFQPSENLGSYRFENGEHVIHLNLDSLYQGKDVLPKLSQTLIHELQHINSPGKDGTDLKTISDKIRFYADPGEMESHVKQIGWIFYSAYPGKLFNVKMLSQILGMDKKTHYKVLLYAFPEKTVEYQESDDSQKGEWQKIKRVFLDKIARYVEKLSGGTKQ